MYYNPCLFRIASLGIKSMRSFMSIPRKPVGAAKTAVISKSFTRYEQEESPYTPEELTRIYLDRCDREMRVFALSEYRVHHILSKELEVRCLCSLSWQTTHVELYYFKAV
jgi:hypothetical protein